MSKSRSYSHLHLLVRALIMDRAQRILVARSDPGFTFLPGGHAAPGESLAFALMRELREELDFTPDCLTYLGAIEHRPEHRPAGDYELNHFFRALPRAGERLDRLNSREQRLTFEWCTLPALDSAVLLPAPVRPLLRSYAQGNVSPWWASTLRGPLPHVT
ncbi:MAG TPA: NUDIX domain-containing protein [Myxococcaceae bacterium]|nr:NUDIX domain-containing protein [Myxococcaceae bacterium]